jgi:hypothetical protein
MNRKDLSLGLVAAAIALWALWPSWFDARVVPANFGDLFAFHQPMRHLAAESLQAGRLPFWNPYIFSGLPLQANPQSVLFYPLSTLGFILPLTTAFAWDFLLHLFWAMLGMALLARHARLPASAAWTAALLYGLSPFLIFRITEGIPTLLAALAWSPWCWLAWAGGRPAWLGLAWALQLLSGHPQFLVVNAAAMGLCAVFTRQPVRRLSELAAGGAWALGLTLLQWAPTREFLALSVRRSWPAAYSLGYSLDWPALSSVVSPLAAGSPLDGSWQGPPSVFFETRALWVGVVGLALAAWGLLSKKKRLAPVLLLACGVLLALGASSPLYRALSPVLSNLRTPSRWLMLSLWGLVACAAAGAARASKTGRGGAAVLFVLVLLELARFDAPFLGRQSAAQYLSVSSHFAEHFGGEPQRLVTSPELANPNKTALYHAMNANGYDAFYLDGYPQYAARSEGRAAADGSRVFLTRLGTPEADRLAIGWRIDEGARLTSSKSALPLAYFATAEDKPVGPPPTLELPSAQRWAVDGFWPAKAAKLVLSQPLYPGWRAWLDGKPAELTLWDGLLQAVARPEGGERKFSARLVFQPTGWTLLLCLTLAAWAAWLADAARRRPA